MAIQVIENRIFQHLRDADGTPIIRKRFGIKDGQEVEIKSGEKDDEGNEIPHFFKFTRKGEVIGDDIKVINAKLKEQKSPFRHGLCIGSVALALKRNNTELEQFFKDMAANEKGAIGPIIIEAMKYHKDYDKNFKPKDGGGIKGFLKKYCEMVKGVKLLEPQSQMFNDLESEFKEMLIHQKDSRDRFGYVITQIGNDGVGHAMCFVKYGSNAAFFDPAYGVFKADTYIFEKFLNDVDILSKQEKIEENNEAKTAYEKSVEKYQERRDKHFKGKVMYYSIW